MEQAFLKRQRIWVGFVFYDVTFPEGTWSMTGTIMRIVKESLKNDKNESSTKDRLQKALHFIW